MVTIALALTALLAATGAALLLLRRRRPRGGMALRVERRPAGLKHLATTVSDLSDLGLHLPAARRPPGKPRLGVLLGLR